MQVVATELISLRRASSFSDAPLRYVTGSLTAISPLRRRWVTRLGAGRLPARETLPRYSGDAWITGG